MAFSMTWIQIETLATAFRQSPGTTTANALDTCLRRFQEPIETFAKLFVQPLIGMQDKNAQFLLSEKGAYPNWACQFNDTQNTFLLNPIGILSFQEECRKAGETAKTQEGRENFKIYRLLAYLQELQKLPFKYLTFLCLFKEVARVMEVTQTDKRRTIHNQPSEAEEDYMSYLWSFKELENAIYKISNIDIRVNYKISWYESDWITVNS